MAINKKLIHFLTRENFEKEKNAGNILDTSICFIKDSQQIYTHKLLYDCKTNQLTPEPGLLLYTTWDNTKLNITHSDIESHIYDESNLYGVITMKTKDSLAENLITNQDNLKSIKVSGSFKVLNGFCISKNKNLIELILEPGIERLGSNADDWSNAYVLGGNESLRDVIIPDTVYIVGTACFEECHGLITVKLPNNPKFTTIPDETFCECDSLLNIDIPNTVTSIGESAFNPCRSLSRVSIPESVTKISDYAFANDPSLTYFELTNKVTNCGHFISDCINLKEFKIPAGYTGKWPLIYNKKYAPLNEGILNRIITEQNVKFTQHSFNIYCRIFDTYFNSIVCESNSTYFPNPLFLEELILRSSTVVTGVDKYLNYKFPTTGDGNNGAPYDGVPLSKLKIYVPNTLLEQYKTTYPTIKNRFFPIAGEQDVYAYLDDLNNYLEKEEAKELYEPKRLVNLLSNSEVITSSNLLFTINVKEGKTYTLYCGKVSATFASTDKSLTLRDSATNLCSIPLGENIVTSFEANETELILIYVLPTNIAYQNNAIAPIAVPAGTTFRLERVTLVEGNKPLYWDNIIEYATKSEVDSFKNEVEETYATKEDLKSKANDNEVIKGIYSYNGLRITPNQTGSINTGNGDIQVVKTDDNSVLLNVNPSGNIATKEVFAGGNSIGLVPAISGPPKELYGTYFLNGNGNWIQPVHTFLYTDTSDKRAILGFSNNTTFDSINYYTNYRNNSVWFTGTGTLGAKNIEAEESIKIGEKNVLVENPVKIVSHIEESGEEDILPQEYFDGIYIDWIGQGSGNNVTGGLFGSDTEDKALGYGSFCLGMDSRASGDGALAIGMLTKASGSLAIAGGYLTEALNEYEFTTGSFNISTTDEFENKDGDTIDDYTLFTIGNGYGDGVMRHNAFEVWNSGRVFIKDFNKTGTHGREDMVCLNDLVSGNNESEVKDVIEDYNRNIGSNIVVVDSSYLILPTDKRVCILDLSNVTYAIYLSRITDHLKIGLELHLIFKCNNQSESGIKIMYPSQLHSIKTDTAYSVETLTSYDEIYFNVYSYAELNIIRITEDLYLCSIPVIKPYVEVKPPEIH